MRKLSAPLTLLLIWSITIGASPALALEAGGKVELNYTGSWFEDGTYIDEVSDSLELELFLPRLGRTEVSYAFDVHNPLQDLTAGKEATYFTKKLYLKHRFAPFHLTVGRQPVSWSFGSLLNPVDYTIGAEAFDEESGSKYTDAVEVYIPLNWNSSLALVTSFPAGFDLETEKMKWGVRGRFGVKGYDLTLNYVQEAEAAGANGSGVTDLISLLPRRRVGVTFKGDLGDLGVYGSFGHYFGEGIEKSNSYLMGVDYSYNIDYYGKLTMQLEYLGLDRSNLTQLLGPFMMISSGKQSTDLLSGSMAYPIDDFSAISLIAIANLDGSNLMIIPGYQNTLPGNIDLDLSILFFLKESDHKFTSIVMGLSYPF
ncbi:MAG TPA: hypothetical protein DEB05_05595 [Firmicutes bacterium]|jgi:hypothetical protein|nr:hypothetical protein [Bacillota bacterium]